MHFSDNLFALFRRNLEGKGIPAEVSSRGEITSRELSVFLDQERRVLPIASSPVCLCELEMGRYAFVRRKLGTMHAVLSYKNDRWSILSCNNETDVWLNGVRLKRKIPYPLRNGDQVTMKGITSFTIYCNTEEHPLRNALEEMLSNLERDIGVYAKSQEKDTAAFSRIMDALFHVPLYGWGGYKPNLATGQIESFFVQIPVHRPADWRPSSEQFDKLNMGTDEPTYIPAFTSEDHAAKGGNILGSFLFDFPLPVFNKIVKMNVDVVINPFSEHSVVIPQKNVRELWDRILEQNDVDDFPEPDSRMHSKLARQMQELEESDDFDDLFGD